MMNNDITFLGRSQYPWVNHFLSVLFLEMAIMSIIIGCGVIIYFIFDYIKKRRDKENGN